MTPKEIAEWKDRIDKMTHKEMASLWRFAPAGHPAFQRDSPLWLYFSKRFNKLGGMTPEVSKEVGWK